MPDDVWYCRIKTAHVPQIVQEHLRDETPVQALLHPRFHPQFDAYSFDS
jgi:(2Fe-2S) ferredoxin